jgi:hypothetical protein
LIQDIKYQITDTLVSASFFIDVEKMNENKIIYSEGTIINSYNTSSKENKSIYKSDFNYPILDIIFTNNHFYFFAWDANTNIIYLYLLEKEKAKLLHSFRCSEYENPGLKSYFDENNIYFTINGYIYSCNLINGKLKKNRSEYIYDFILSKDCIIYVHSYSNVEGERRNIFLEKMNNDFTNKRQIISDFRYCHTDKLFFEKDILYVYYSLSKEKYKINDNQFSKIQEIPVFENDKYSVFFTDDNTFRIVYQKIGNE